MKNRILIWVCILSSYCYAQSNIVNLTPSQDNTVYQDNVNNSSGLGELFSGLTNMGSIRRALIQFDLSSIPTGATIESVTLTLNVSNISNNLNQPTTNYTLHRITTQWGEGTSDGGGSGASAIAPDATWNRAEFPNIFWNTIGGDFITTASATTSFNNQVGSQTFNSSTDLVNDVQNWLDGVNPNFGWILIGDEITNATARVINSKDDGPIPPTLTITFDDTLSTENFTLANTVTVYPNPSNNGIFNISSENINFQNVEILNFLGQTVLTIDLKNGSSLKTIDLSNSINNGIYFLKLIDTENRFIIKRIVLN